METRASRIGLTLPVPWGTKDTAYVKVERDLPSAYPSDEEVKEGFYKLEQLIQSWADNPKAPSNQAHPVPEQRDTQPEKPNQNGALRILTHARQNCPDQSPKMIEKITVKEFEDHYKVSSPFFGTDEQGKKMFAKFATAMKEVGGVWDSEQRPDRPDKRFYFFRIPKPR